MAPAGLGTDDGLMVGNSPDAFPPLLRYDPVPVPFSPDGKLLSGILAFLAAATAGVVAALVAAVTATDTAALVFTDLAAAVAVEAAVAVRVALVADVSLAGTLIWACSWRALELG